MRYPASEKLEIIRLVEQSHLPVKRPLEKLWSSPGFVDSYGLADSSRWRMLLS